MNDQSHHQLISMLDTLLAKMDAETKKKKLQEEHNLSMTIKLEKEMKEASRRLEFEYAAILRDRIMELRGGK